MPKSINFFVSFILAVSNNGHVIKNINTNFVNGFTTISSSLSLLSLNHATSATKSTNYDGNKSFSFASMSNEHEPSSSFSHNTKDLLHRPTIHPNKSSLMSTSSASNISTSSKKKQRKEQRKQRIKKTKILQERKRDWINQSLTYYATVSRESKRRQNGQYMPSQIELNQFKSTFVTAKKLYFARHKIKKNQLRHAERIYRKLIDDLLREQEEEGSCDNAQLAISTLLLALLLQRQGEVKETRATFVRFFRLITMNDDDKQLNECTCSAKVVQAFALFEMKQGNVKKAYALIQTAVELDNELEPVLQWKQFRDAKQLVEKRCG